MTRETNTAVPFPPTGAAADADHGDPPPSPADAEDVLDFHLRQARARAADGDSSDRVASWDSAI